MGAIVRKQTCELATELAAKVHRYASASITEGTRAGYRRYFSYFTDWCERHGYRNLPASGETITLYLAEVANRYQPKLISQILTAIGYAHRAVGLTFDRSRFDLILRGIARTYGLPSKQAAAISINQLRKMVTGLPDTPIGARDRLLLTLGFAGALRPGELVGLNIGRLDGDSLGLLEVRADGLRLTICRMFGGHEPIIKAIPRGGSPCPVEALERWLALTEINHGPVLRGFNPGGVLRGRLNGQTVTKVIKKALYAEALKSGLDPEAARNRMDGFNGHSLRVGFVTSAVRAGASSESIARHVGWKSIYMVGHYRRRGGVFHKHPVQRVLAS